MRSRSVRSRFRLRGRCCSRVRQGALRRRGPNRGRGNSRFDDLTDLSAHDVRNRGYERRCVHHLQERWGSGRRDPGHRARLGRRDRRINLGYHAATGTGSGAPRDRLCCLRDATIRGCRLDVTHSHSDSTDVLGQQGTSHVQSVTTPFPAPAAFSTGVESCMPFGGAPVFTDPATAHIDLRSSHRNSPGRLIRIRVPRHRNLQ